MISENKYIENQIGGSFFRGLNKQIKNGEKKICWKACYFSVFIKDDTLLHNFFLMKINRLLLNRLLEGTGFQPHLTLIKFDINIDHPLNLNSNKFDKNNNFAYKTNQNVLLSEKFIKAMEVSENDFYRIFKPTTFKTKTLEVLGKDQKYLAQKILPDNWEEYELFILMILTKLQNYIATLGEMIVEMTVEMIVENLEGIDYNNIYVNGERLISIPKYYVDFNIANPHISLVKLTDEAKRTNLAATSIKDIEETTKIAFTFNKECVELHLS